MYNRALPIIFLVVVAQATSAQSLKKDIQILAKPKKEGVWLRWAPTNPTVWQLGNKYGYIVERFSLKPNGDLENPEGTKLSINPLKPLSASALEKMAEINKDAAALSEIIYGTESVVSNVNSLSNILAKKDEDENKFGVALLICDLSVDMAKAAGLYIKDSTASIGKRYIYRVSLAQKPTSMTVEPGVIVVDVTAEKPLLEIKDLQAEFRDYTAMLSWATLFHQGVYSFYYIEKSTDGKNFKKVSDLPYAHMSETPDAETAFFLDSLEANAKTFYYRIKGVTPFGETGPPSNVVKGEGKDNLSGLLIIREGKVFVDDSNSKKEKPLKNKKQIMPVSHKVTINWEFPTEAENQIAGFVVSRAPGADGPYTDVTPVLAKNVRSFDDKTLTNNTYYQLRAVDKLKNEVSRSYPFLVQAEDNTPPQPPSKVIGSVDSVGVVSLSWMANSDVDLMGYRVFRSNALTEEPVEVTKIILVNPMFVDTVNIRVLNKEIFYNVVAVDKNFNASSYSVPLKLLRPDIIPPAPPVFTRSEVRRDTLLLEWKNSVSADIAKYELVRIEEGQPAKTIVTWSQTSLKNSLAEKSLLPGKTYQYRLTVVDSAGNTSSAETGKILFEPGFRKEVRDLKAAVDRENKKITLTWTEQPSVVGYFVFRKMNNGSYVLYKTIDGNAPTLIDKGIVINNEFCYKVQALYPSGVKSVLSKEIKVKY